MPSNVQNSCEYHRHKISLISVFFPYTSNENSVSYVSSTERQKIMFIASYVYTFSLRKIYETRTMEGVLTLKTTRNSKVIW